MIILRNNGTLSYYNPHSENVIYIDEVDPEKVLEFSSQDVELDKEVTLRSYFEMLTKYPLLRKLYPYCEKFTEHYNEVKDKDIYKEECWCELNYIGIGHVDIADDFEHDRIESYYNVDGYGYDKKDPEKKEVNIGIEFDYFMNLIDIPLKIYGSEIIVTKNRNHFVEVFSDEKSHIRLYDFVVALIDELSFNGNVCEVDEERLKLDEIIEEVNSDVVDIKTVVKDRFVYDTRKFIFKDYEKLCKFITWMEIQRKELINNIKHARDNKLDKFIIEYNYRMYLLYKDQIKEASKEALNTKNKIKSLQREINDNYLASINK